MVRNQARSNRKPSGARLKKQFVRRQHEVGGTPALTRVDTDKRKTVRTLGGNEKVKSLQAKTAHVVDKKTGKHVTATIMSVRENPANRHFVRRNIMTKGTVVETDKGAALITSRPGQDGAVLGVLLNE